MLLDLNARSISGAGILLPMAAALLLACPRLCIGAATQDVCVVQVPLYNYDGRRAAATIVRVSPTERPDVNLLSGTLPGAKFTVAGDRLSFPKALLQQSVRVTFQNPQGQTSGGTLPLFTCRQRTSFLWGFGKSTLDVNSTTVEGRLRGCLFTGDWWVRAMPIFGGHNYQAVFEGAVDANGAFWLAGGMMTERHLIIVGREREPVKALAYDVLEGGKNNIGTVDLSGACPK